MSKLPMRPGQFFLLYLALTVASVVPLLFAWPLAGYFSLVPLTTVSALQLLWTWRATRYSEQAASCSQLSRTKRTEYAIVVLGLLFAVAMINEALFAADANSDAPGSVFLLFGIFASLAYVLWQGGAALNEAEPRPSRARAIGGALLFLYIPIGVWFLYDRLKRLPS